MSLPKFNRQIERMAENDALQTKTARSILRHANLPPSAGQSGPRNVIDGFISPFETLFARQWATDLTGVTRARFTSRSSSTLYVFFSPLYAQLLGDLPENQLLDPNNYNPLASVGGSVFQGSAGTEQGWMEIHPEARLAVRLAVSTSNQSVEWLRSKLDGPCSVALQVA